MPVSRRSVCRAWCTTFPTVLNSRKRSRFGRAVAKSPGKVSRLSAVSRLYASTFSRNQAAFAPNLPLWRATAMRSRAPLGEAPRTTRPGVAGMRPNGRPAWIGMSGRYGPVHAPEVQEVPIDNAPVGAPVLLGDAPVPVFLAVLRAGMALQVHGGRSVAQSPARAKRVGLDRVGFPKTCR